MRLYIFSILLLSVNSICYSQTLYDPTHMLGRQMLPTSLQDVNDSTVTIFDSTSMKYTFVDLYFNECGPCNANIPKIKKLQQKFGNKLVIVTANKNNYKYEIIEHAKKYNTNFIDLSDKSALTIYELFDYKKFDAFGYPTYFLISPEGKVIFGSMNSNSWHKKVAKLIK